MFLVVAVVVYVMGAAQPTEFVQTHSDMSVAKPMNESDIKEILFPLIIIPIVITMRVFHCEWLQ